MGESQKQGFQLSFNRFLRVAFQGSRVTSNGGLILVRELDERLGFGELSLIFHSFTLIQGFCFRSAQNPFGLLDLHF